MNAPTDPTVGVRARRPFLVALAAALGLACGPALAQTPPDEPQPPQRPSGGAAPSDDAFEMGSPPRLADGLTEEDMWPAATEEGWKQPVLVHWQRSFDDAMAVARAEKRPVLVCVNMDGEIASEHFAGVRYREPETAERMSKYVCVIASVYRHTPRDHDEEGKRVECPRFGTVTCGEHIRAERELYDRYFDGRRISPRHIVLDLEGKETYDVYFSWDTASVFKTFVKGVEGWPQPVEREATTVEELARSRDVRHRERLEAVYSSGDRARKREILIALQDEQVADQVEVLRAAISGLDLELAKQARIALARCETEKSLDVIAEALKGELEVTERERLLDAVRRMASRSKRARTLAALHGGLAPDSRHFDSERLASAAAEYEASAAYGGVDVDALEDAAESGAEPARAKLDLALALLDRAYAQPASEYASLWMRDARAAARDAEELGASGPRLDAVLAALEDAAGDQRAAHERAVRAVEDGLLLAGDDASPAAGLSPAVQRRVLELFADARRRAIRGAYRRGAEWPPEWLSDVNAAHSILVEGPLRDESVIVEHHDFLRWIGASRRANAVLEEGLERFPDSPVLHDRQRGRLLYEGGPEGLVRDYAERIAREHAEGETRPTQIVWFAGYANLVAAEHHRRRGEFEAAREAYERGIAFYEQSAADAPSGKDTCDHFVALARAGLARIALGRGELDAATDELLAAFARRPDSAATADGLGLTPIMTAKMLHARLLEAGDEERAADVRATLEALDPELLEPPPSELPPGGRRGGSGR